MNLPVEKLIWRERKALKHLEGRELLYTYQLPREIGCKTMEKLVERGLLVVVNGHKGRYSMEYGWQLVKLTISKSEIKAALVR